MFSRFIINGLFATLVHYLMLNFNIKIIGFESSGFANFVASLFGITVSFLGNKYYVFKSNAKNVFCRMQFLKFVFFYLLISFFHGIFLFIWTDKYILSYHLGFFIAVSLQVFMSFLINKKIVFNEQINSIKDL